MQLVIELGFKFCLTKIHSLHIMLLLSGPAQKPFSFQKVPSEHATLNDLVILPSSLTTQHTSPGGDFISNAVYHSVTKFLRKNALIFLVFHTSFCFF